MWNSLVDATNCIKKRKNDYETRGGLTQEPIVEDDLKMVSPLHCLMRCFDFVLKLIYHLMSETFQWTESNKKLGKHAESYFKAKNYAHEVIKQQTGIKVDIPDSAGKGGSTTTGNVCERMLKDYRYILVSLVPNTFQPALIEFLNRLWVILYMYTSQTKAVQVHIPLFREFCVTTYQLLLKSFNNSESKWINVSPTLHMLLAHSWELIEINNCCGLGEYSETGLENNNNFLRFFRKFLARKKSVL